MESAVAGLNRKAWVWFFVAALMAAAWFGVNALLPNLAIGPVLMSMVFVLGWCAVFLCGLGRALPRAAALSPGRRVAAWLGTATVLAVWIATTWVLAEEGIFQRDFGRVPLLPLAIVVPVLLGALVLRRSRTVGRVLEATPKSWLMGLQVYRVLGAMFLVHWVYGNMPGEFALPAGIGDVATGLLALPAAMWVASGLPVGRKIGVRWNLLGLVDFAVAITMGMLTSPGPAHLLALDHPNTQIAVFPGVMTPAFVVPFSVLLHLLSLRQLRRAGERDAEAKRALVAI